MPQGDTILVIDDEAIMQEILADFLREEGFEVDIAGSGEEGLDLARERPYDCAIVDLMMPGIDGIETMQALKGRDPELPVIMITAFASVESAVEAMKRGAHEYITKPFKNDEVLVVLQNAIRQRRLEEEVRTLRKALKDKYRFESIIGKNRRMQDVFALIEQAAPSRSTILIQGESGTGKELVAKAIHANSTRAEKSFVVVNSGSMPSDLLESNLFGHVRGAFTGAVSSKKGLFEVADGGSIFFDEVENAFREDLYYRLNVITVNLPPLRERPDDIPLLAQHFLDKYGDENRRDDLFIEEEALSLLRSYQWPGNVRELENAIERAVVLAPRSGQVTAELIRDYLESNGFESPRPAFSVSPEGLPMKDVVQKFQKQLIVDALRKTGWIQKDAAELLDVKPTTLNEMIKRYGIREEVKERSS